MKRLLTLWIKDVGYSYIFHPLTSFPPSTQNTNGGNVCIHMHVTFHAVLFCLSSSISFFLLWPLIWAKTSWYCHWLFSILLPCPSCLPPLTPGVPVVAFLKPWNIWDWPFQMGLGEEGVDYLALKGKEKIECISTLSQGFGIRGTAAYCGLLESWIPGFIL